MTNNYEKIKELEQQIEEKRKEIQELDNRKTKLLHESYENIIVKKLVFRSGPFPIDDEIYVTCYDMGLCSFEHAKELIEFAKANALSHFDKHAIFKILTVSSEEASIYHKLTNLDAAKFAIKRAGLYFSGEKYSIFEDMEYAIDIKKEDLAIELDFEYDLNNTVFRYGSELSEPESYYLV